MDYLVDTMFLIGRWRNQRTGPEQCFIDEHHDVSLGIPWVVKAEFLKGSEFARHNADEVMEFINRYRVVWPDEKTLTIYAHLYAQLRQSGKMIGLHDLWIASSALQTDLPLVTRNVKEFSRVPGLRIEDYAK